MNKDRRKRLHDIAKRLSAIRDAIEHALCEARIRADQTVQAAL